jgi:DNA polymerase-3 subunit delta
MPSEPQGQVRLIHGGDEYSVKQRGREVYQEWTHSIGGADHEIIDAAAGNAGEAVRSLNQLRMALDTLPFFGTGKVVWLRDCSFLGDDRTSGAALVTERLAELVPFLQGFAWDNVRLLVTAGKVDKRRSFYRALEKLGDVEHYPELSAEAPDWMERMVEAAERAFRATGKRVESEVLADLAVQVGPNLRQLHQEIEKLGLYVGDREEIRREDVKAVVSRNRQARAFALGDALGERDVPGLLRALGEELWEARVDRKKSEVGILYGLISKVRGMLLAKELLREGWLKPERDFSRFKGQLARLADKPLPEDKKYNPRAMNAFVLFRAAQHARHYSTDELVAAMERLLECNQQLVGSNLDEATVLQRALVGIAATPAARSQDHGARP